MKTLILRPIDKEDRCADCKRSAVVSVLFRTPGWGAESRACKMHVLDLVRETRSEWDIRPEFGPRPNPRNRRVRDAIIRASFGTTAE